MEYKEYRGKINIKLDELYEKYPKVHKRIGEVSVSTMRNCVMIYFNEGDVMLDITAHYTRKVGVVNDDTQDVDRFCEEMELFLSENLARRRKKCEN